MSLTIIADVGSADANSFVTADEMTAYCAARLNASVWTAADAQLPALVEATREITLLDFVGTRVTAAQALAWPREAAPDPDAPILETIPGATFPGCFAADAIPQRVKDATCELALQFLKAGTSDLAVADPDSGVIEKTVDVLTTKWASASDRPTGWARFPRVLGLVTPLLRTTGGGLDLVRM